MGMPGAGYMNLYDFMPPWFTSGQPSHVSTPTPMSHMASMLSSDPPDEEAANPYPDIREFLIKLDYRCPKCFLVRHADDFDSKDLYNINEILKLSAERLTSPDFGLSLGNAQFLWDATTDEEKRIKCGKGKRLHQA